MRFAGAFDGAGLAMFMCATGYSTVLEDMVFSVAKSPNRRSHFHSHLPGSSHESTPIVKKTAKNAGESCYGAKAGSGKTGSGESLEDVVKEAAAFVATCLKDCADTCTSSLKQVQKGNYKVEDAWSDGIKLWSTYVAGWQRRSTRDACGRKRSPRNPPTELSR